MKKNLILVALIAALSTNHILNVCDGETKDNLNGYEFKPFRDTFEERLTEYLEELKNQESVASCMRIQEEYEPIEVAAYVEQVEYEEEYVEEYVEEYTYANYNPYNLLEPSNITREQAYEILEGTALQALSSAYVYMEEIYGVNAIWLMALNAEESGWGRSGLAIYNNNLGGVKTVNGDWAYFEDWYDSLDFITSMIRYEYLSEDGLFYNGYSIWNVNSMYCEGTQWAENINSIANSLLNKCY